MKTSQDLLHVIMIVNSGSVYVYALNTEGTVVYLKGSSQSYTGRTFCAFMSETF